MDFNVINVASGPCHVVSLSQSATLLWCLCGARAASSPPPWLGATAPPSPLTAPTLAVVRRKQANGCGFACLRGSGTLIWTLRYNRSGFPLGFSESIRGYRRAGWRRKMSVSDFRISSSDPLIASFSSRPARNQLKRAAIHEIWLFGK